MKLLLDTHSFLWFISGDPRLSLTARTLIEDTRNEAFLSVASLWEIAIKISLGRLQLTQPLEVLIPQQLSLNTDRSVGDYHQSCGPSGGVALSSPRSFRSAPRCASFGGPDGFGQPGSGA